MDDDLQNFQALRAIDKDNLDNSPSSSAPGGIFRVDTYLDPATQKTIVLWDDILLAFEHAVHVRHKSQVVPFLKEDFNPLIPHRIAAVAATVLDVVVRGNSSSATVVTPNSTSMETSPATPLQETTSFPITIGNNGPNIVRRNPAGGLVEAAMENYTHMENPATAPKLRGPHAILDDQAPCDDASKESKPSTDNDIPGHGRQEHPFAATIHFAELVTNARLGDKHAQNALGDMYRDGREVLQDHQGAMDWYLRAAEQGHTDARCKVGLMFEKGQGMGQDYSIAMHWYIKAGKEGSLAAQVKVGNLYRNGLDVAKDFSAAMDWYLKAANEGYAIAQYNVGDMYHHGQGVPQDYTKAMEWFRKAVDQDDSEAECSIGDLYAYGQGVPLDYSQSMQWYLKAAKQENARAQTKIGHQYRLGQGVLENPAKAKAWYRKAALQGNASAQYEIGCLYDSGQGVPRSYTEAMYWYQKSAKQGHVNTQATLVLCTNTVEAYRRIILRLWNGISSLHTKESPYPSAILAQCIVKA